MNDHKATVQKFYETIWNKADKSAIPELMHEDVTFRGSLGLANRGHAGFANYIDFVCSALGDYHCKVVDMVAEGDKVFARMHYSGMHKGELFGYAATNAKLKWEGMAAFTFSDGKITDIWALGDVHSVMKQLSKYVMD